MGGVTELRSSSSARYGAAFMPELPLAVDDDTVAFHRLDEDAGNESADLGPGHFDLAWTGPKWGFCGP